VTSAGEPLNEYCGLDQRSTNQPEQFTDEEKWWQKLVD
jgi:hypothetical protein